MGPDERSGEESDEALVEAARGGKPGAFERLLERYEAQVLRVVRLLGVPREDREDVAQEVFVRIFRHLPGYRTALPFGGWLYRITINATHDYRRRVRRRREAASWDPAADVRMDPGERPGDRIDRLEHRRRIESAIEELSERERAVFVLSEMEGLPTREIARTMGITSITVRRHLGRARNRLREMLGRRED